MQPMRQRDLTHPYENLIDFPVGRLPTTYTFERYRPQWRASPEVQEALIRWKQSEGELEPWSPSTLMQSVAVFGGIGLVIGIWIGSLI